MWSDPCYLKTCPNHDEKDLAGDPTLGWSLLSSNLFPIQLSHNFSDFKERSCCFANGKTSDAFDSNALKHDGLRYREDDYRINRRSNKMDVLSDLR
ncbi:hypothetical protein HZH66_014626 [Vespula vulgaris]|uniref:Uncharacterized protein n=1 Tax=Vespula vulgaris TaxID=7454 RepID=A0A834J140_VESVU|nr:hypothetical protein HZH66_014626 [Vespula vulgaris]